MRLFGEPYGQGRETMFIRPNIGQSWGFTSCSTARVILGQAFIIASCGNRIQEKRGLGKKGPRKKGPKNMGA